MLETLGVVEGLVLSEWVMGFLWWFLERSVGWFDGSDERKPRFVSKSYSEGPGEFVMLEIFGVWRS